METPPTLSSLLPAPDAEDAPKIGHKSARSQRVEVISRGERRRVWTLGQKREIVAESLGADLTPTEVARKYAISSGQLYTWRQKILGGQIAQHVRSVPRFAQVEVADAKREQPGVAPAPVAPLRPQGLIEIELADGVILRVDTQVDSQALCRVLQALTDR